MKKIKILVASVLCCAMGYTGYTAYEKMTMSEVEKFMIANVEALTKSESDVEGGKALCYNSYTIVDNHEILRCVSCEYVQGIGDGKTGYCKW